MTRKSTILLMMLVALLVAVPVAAQEDSDSPGDVDWGILAAGFAIGIAAAGGAAGQGRAAAAAVEAIARNPSASGDIRTALILGLALIESLVIYALLIAMRGAAFF